MAEQTFEFRVPYGKFIIGMLLTVAPISLAALYSITRSTDELRRSVGNQYAHLAGAIASEVAQFVRFHVTEAGLMAADSAVLEAVRAANRSYASLSPDQISARINRLEEIWNEPAGVEHVNRILSSPASQSLRRKLAIDVKFLRITVTDAQGATVAASHKTLDYNQADEQYWQDIYADGRGAVSLTDILYDEATKANYIGIGVPVVEPDSGEFIGTFDALVDLSSLFPLVRRAELGAEARVLLVKGDGTIIAGSGGENLAMDLSSREFDALVDAGHMRRGAASGYMVSAFPNTGDTLVAFALTGLGADYQRLDWTVVLAQPTQHAFAAILSSQRVIMLIAFLSLAAVVFAGVFFSLHRRDEIDEMEEQMRQRAPAGAEAPKEG